MVRPSLVDAVIWQESRGDPKAVSPVGAMGLMQIMPATARDPGFGIKPLQDPFDPDENKRFGTEYLGAMLKRYNGDKEAALAAYNWGSGNADKWVQAGKPVDMLPEETRNYIPSVLGKEQELAQSAKVPASSQTVRPADITALSDEELLQLRQQSQPSITQLSDEQLLAMRSQQQPDYANMSGKDVALKAAKNLPSSIARELGGVWDAITNPVDTAKALATLGEGMIRLAVPGGDDPSEDAARAVGQFYVDRYGSLEGFKKALAEEPASVLSDLSVPLTVGAGAVAKSAQQGSRLAKIARGAERVASNLDVTNVIGGAATNILDTKPLDKAVDFLKREGITLTPGQMQGGRLRAFEEKLKDTVPVVGDAIASNYQKSINEFNRAAYNRALRPIGLDVKKANINELGFEAVNKISDTLSKEYEKVLPNLNLAIENSFVDSVENIVNSRAADLTTPYAKKLQKIYERTLEKKFYSKDKLSGRDLKEIDSTLSAEIRRYRKSPDPEDNIIKNSLSDVQQILRAEISNSNPKYAGRLRRLDDAYSNYVILRRAMSSAGDKAEGFTPSQLNNAIRTMDTSVGKGDVARGRAKMQDLSSAAMAILPDKLPDSQTAARTALAALMGGAVTIEPLSAALIALGASPYAARKTAMSAMAGQKAARQKIVKMLEKVPNITGPALSEVAQTKETVENDE